MASTQHTPPTAAATMEACQLTLFATVNVHPQASSALSSTQIIPRSVHVGNSSHAAVFDTSDKHGTTVVNAALPKQRSTKLVQPSVMSSWV